MGALREQLAGGHTVWAAGIYDSLSARLAEEAGFDAVMTGGLGMSASLLGMPDFELLTLTENVGVVARAAKAVSIPVIADIDTGYGNTVNVSRSVAEFRAAGAQAVIMEDQVSPKRCAACVDETELIPIDEASAKIRSGPPNDDEADLGLPHWAGVVPLRLAAGRPEPDDGARSVAVPDHVTALVHGRS